MAFLGPSLRRTKVHDRPGRRLVLAALASLLVNGLALFLLARAGAFDTGKRLAKQEVAIAPLSADQWSSNRTIRPPNALPAPAPKVLPPTPPPQAKQEDATPPKQVVDVAPSKDHRPPKDPRYLSEQDNRVEKETRSRLQGSGVFRNRAPTVVPGPSRPRKGGEGGEDDETKQARQGDRATKQQGGKGEPRPEQSQDDRLALLDHPTLPRTSPGPRSGGDEGVAIPGVPGTPGTPQEGKRKAGDPRLLPSVDSMSKIAAGPSADALDPDIEEGDVTALNTKAFIHSTFWNRFKQDVAEHWIPLVRYEMIDRDPNGAIYGRNDRVTGLRIVLDAGGAVKKIEVVESCGLGFLDQLAVNAVRDASPFYNVPPALLNSSKELAFSFGFMIERNRGVPVRPRYGP